MFNKLTDFIKVIGLKRLLLLLLIAVAILGVGGSYYFYNKYQEIKANPNLEAQKETAALVSALGKLMELPAGETPTIASVSDKEKLSNQPFFKMAENGDKLFAYNTAMLAILYRPSTNKIINVAPISISQQQSPASSVTSSASSPALLRITYYNGTDVAGLAKTTEATVKGTYPNSQTILLTDSSLKNYTQTLVVDLSGTHSKEATVIAGLLQGKDGTLPQGEKKPDADILIITGK